MRYKEFLFYYYFYTIFIEKDSNSRFQIQRSNVEIYIIYIKFFNYFIVQISNLLILFKKIY